MKCNSALHWYEEGAHTQQHTLLSKPDNTTKTMQVCVFVCVWGKQTEGAGDLESRSSQSYNYAADFFFFSLSLLNVITLL